MAKATPPRSGDMLAGIAASCAEENVAAKLCLADVPLTALSRRSAHSLRERRGHPAHPRHARSRGLRADRASDGRRIPRFPAVGRGDAEIVGALAPGITPEMAAAVSKLMRNQDLILAAQKCRVVTRFRNTIGLPGTMAVRLQPNHPTDDRAGHRRLDHRRPAATAAATR